MMMKTWMITGLHAMEILEIPRPEISQPHDVLVRMKRVGVCGSDIHYYKTGRIGDQVVQYPYTVGHECSGVVEAVGTAVKSVRVGDRVAIEPAMPCNRCDQCMAGRHHTCRNLKFLGTPGQADGSLREYLVMPETSCLPLPQKMTLDQGVLTEPLAIAVHSCRLGPVTQGASIAILGFGPIGMSVYLAARAMGAGYVFVTDKIDDRLLKAANLGADLTGNPDREDIVGKSMEKGKKEYDLVFECCGEQEAVDQAIHLLGPGGKLVIAGIPEVDHFTFNIHLARRKELNIQNVRRQNHAVEEAFRLIHEKVIYIDPMVTHHFPFQKAKEAFDLVSVYGDGVMKAIITLDD